MPTELRSPITADGEYYVNLPRTEDTFLDVFGTFTTATVVASIGDLVADGGRTIPEFASLTAPVSEPKKAFLPQGRIYFKVTGSTSESIEIKIKQNK
jgi:hypothetical protein